MPPVAPPQFDGTHGAHKTKQHKTIKLSIPVFIVLIVAIVLSFFTGVFVQTQILRNRVNQYKAQIARLEETINSAPNKPDSDTADGNADSNSPGMDSTRPNAITVTGGQYQGTDGGGYGEGYATLQNNSGHVLSGISLTFAYLDSNGNILSENYAQPQSQLHPGQKMNVDTQIDLSKNNIKYFQVTEVDYFIDGDQGTLYRQTVDGPKIEVK